MNTTKKSMKKLINVWITILPLFLFAAISFPATSHASLTDGLVGYWTFDGKDTNWRTNTTNDRAGTNHGTMTSMSTTTSPVAGKIGQGLKFDGSTSFVSVANTITTRSVSFW